MKKTVAFKSDYDYRGLYHTARAAREAEFDAMFKKIFHGLLTNADVELVGKSLRSNSYYTARDNFIAAAEYLKRHEKVLTGVENDPEERKENE